MMKPTQANRRIAVTTPLGDDVLLVRRFSVSEQLGRLFQIQLDLVSTEFEIDFDAITGQNITLRIDLPLGGERYFNGHVSRFTQSGADENFAHYQATVVPWLWFLTRRADCRIFQSTMDNPPDEMTAPGIVKKVFTDAGFHDFEDRLSMSHRKWEYCVQYRETDFNFVSRLMEQEGIYYYFEHVDGKHTLVLADSISSHEPFPDYEQLPYKIERSQLTERENISDWVITSQVQPGSYALTDYHYDSPRKLLRTSAVVKSTASHMATGYQIFDFPGEYTEYAEGETYSRVRIEELHVEEKIVNGNSTAAGLCCGATFKLEDHPVGDQNREHLLTATAYSFDAGEFESGGVGGGEFCSCSFTAIDSRVAFRPARLTPKPSISGVQTAVVVGPKGEEIHTDKHARVKVQFHWDRYGRNDENSSCWIRVSHAMAGNGWGAMITPRIGQEVIVEFLEGDPDRPIITGRVYNGDKPPPYANAMGVVSGMKSDTHKGDGYNEIAMDDTAGKEKIDIHAQHDMNTVVEHDRTDWIKNDETVTIDRDRKEKVGSNETITIGKDRKEDVGANETVKIGTDRTIEVGSNQSATIGKNRSAEVGQNDQVNVGKNFILDAGDSITIKTGSASITMKKDGTIAIKGKDIKIEGSGKINVKASSDVVIKGSKVGLN